jgi:Fe-coproporphyrin III synthase
MRCTGASRIVQVHPTRLCNLRCLHCYSASGPDVRGELEVGLLCEALAGAHALGYTAMTVSGGEPLLYRPLPELLAGARRLGMLTALTTNGMLLDERRLASLAGILDLLVISLDGTPDSHNRMRNHPRAFATLAARLPLVRRAGLRFGFLFTLTQYNLHELDWVAAFAAEQGAELLQIHPLEAAGRASELLPGECPDDEEGSWTLLVAAALQERYRGRLHVKLDLVSRRALAGLASSFSAVAAAGDAATALLADLVQPLVIEADGEVVPLEYGFPRRLSLGNLRAAPLGVLADRWRREHYTEFHSLCRSAFASVADAPAGAAPLTNLSDALRRAGSMPPSLATA